MLYLYFWLRLQLYKRLKERSTEPEEKILARVEKSKQELKEINRFENLIINEEGKIEETAQSIIKTIQVHRQNKQAFSN
jgi:guanylate kinase